MKHLLLLCCTAAAVFGASSLPTAPVKKFRLPTFNAEGFRTGFLTGEEALIVSAGQIDIKEMHLSTFSGDEAGTLETTLLAPVATVRVQEREQIRVEGKQSVRLVRPEVDATGQDWEYDHQNKRLLIRSDVHVVYRAVLKDFLK